MITVENAIELTKLHSQKIKKSYSISISKALGYVLAEDVIAPIAIPPFPQSAMDGYALGSLSEQKFDLIGEVKAGDNSTATLLKGQAIRIFTGAPVPDGTQTVIMQEKIEVKDNFVIPQEPVMSNANIRPIGEQIKKGTVALEKETVLTAAGIGYLASLGVTHVQIYQQPSIAIITTGNELVSPGQQLKHGQIYESNSIMLSTALLQSGFTDVSCYKVEDDYNLTLSLLENTIDHHDVVLISGGISVGDYDFVGKALRALQVEEIFYKVKQKPGKPLYFAKKQSTTIFALPGNPASSLSCFYVYVLPSIYKISGYQHSQLKRRMVNTSTSYQKKGKRAEFLKAIVENDTVTILDGQASSMLRSFALANALVYLPEDITTVHEGDTVEVIHLP